MKTILITGGAGFVGSNVAARIRQEYPNSRIILFDNLIRQGSEINAARLSDEGMEFVKGDVRNKEALMALDKVDCIIECSAEPAVLAGYEDPHYMIDTNLVGAVHCLELAKRDNAAFIFLSTSRVYPIAPVNEIEFEEKDTRFDWQGSFKGINEDFTLQGVRSLYGASKLAAEHLVTEFMDMYGFPAVITRFGVIAGPWQMGKIDQGIVGFWLARHLFGGELKYIGYNGSGKQLRDILHVDDATELVVQQVKNIKSCSGQVFNAGGGKTNTVSLLELTEKCAELTSNTLKIGREPKERKADVRIYYTDNSKVTAALGWKPQRTTDDILKDTYTWLNGHTDTLKPILGS